jgi:hypothetical protein
MPLKSEVSNAIIPGRKKNFTRRRRQGLKLRRSSA